VQSKVCSSTHSQIHAVQLNCYKHTGKLDCHENTQFNRTAQNVVTQTVERVQFGCAVRVGQSACPIDGTGHGVASWKYNTNLVQRDAAVVVDAPKKRAIMMCAQMTYMQALAGSRLMRVPAGRSDGDCSMEA